MKGRADLDMIDAKDRLAAVAVELTNVRGVIEVRDHFGDIDHGHAQDGIIAFLDVATRNTIEALGGVLFAMDHPVTDGAGR